MASAEINVRKIDNLWLVRARGTPLERAKALGRLVREGALPRETQDFFSDIIDQYHATYPWTVRLPAKALYLLWRATRFQEDAVGLTREMRAFAEEAGMNHESLHKGLVLPDVIASTLGGLKMLEGPVLRFGCSSVARKTADGKFVTGRNLDFTGVGIWDKAQMVYVALPEEGEAGKADGELAHVAITASPLFFGSITGINEAGIKFAIHQTYTKEVTGKGLPIYLIGEQVLRRARTLEQALEILRTHRPGPLWICNLADHKTGRAVAVETSAQRFCVREGEAGCFAQMNHLLSLGPEERARIEAIPHSIGQNSRHRQAQAAPRVEQTQDIRDVARILALRAHPHSRVTSPRDIQKPATIQTCLTQSQHGELTDLWVSMDAAPTASGRFVRFSPRELFDATRPLDEVQAVIENPAGSPAEVRARELEMVELLQLWEKNRIAEVLERFPPGVRDTELVIRQLCLYKLRRDAEMEKGFARDPHAGGRLDHEDALAVLLIELLSAWRSGAPESERLELVRAIEALGPVDPAALELVSRTKRGRKPGPYLFNPTYDWFGGALCWRFGW